ncbi:MAG: redoxin domain-containing protein [Nitrososphaerota archaeon]
MRRRKTGKLGAVILVDLTTAIVTVVELTVLGLQQRGGPSGSLSTVGHRALDIVLHTMSGESITLYQLLAQGKPVLVYFYATWCPVCDDDIRNLAAAEDGFSYRVSVVLVGVDVTETDAEVRRFAERHGRDGWLVAKPNREMITALNIVTQATKLTFSIDGELVFRQGYGRMGVDGWKSILSNIVEKS